MRAAVVLGPMNAAEIISFVVLVWSVAVLCKLAATRARGVPYVFRQWDGGLALGGRVLGRTGAIALAALCFACAGVAVYLLSCIGVSR